MKNNMSIDNIKREKDVKVMIATEDNSPVFLIKEKYLYREGRVKFRLAQQFGDHVCSFIRTIGENKYEIYLSMDYLDLRMGEFVYSKYTEMHDRLSLQNNYFVKEITRQVSKILGKEILTNADFLNLECEAEIITDASNDGVQYSKFTKLKVYKVDKNKKKKKKHYSLNKNTLDKSYTELDESDILELEKLLNLDSKTSMYKYKIHEIEMFCKNIEPIEKFLYRGKTFMRLSAYLKGYRNKSSDEIHEYIMDKIKYFDIKPACIFIAEGDCCLEYMPKNHFHFRHWYDYLKLKISFIEFIESINIDGVELDYELDNDEIREIDENLPVLSNIEFSKELFEHERIEIYGEYTYVIDINDIKNYKEYDGKIIIETVTLD